METTQLGYWSLNVVFVVAFGFGFGGRVVVVRSRRNELQFWYLQLNLSK